MLPRWRVIAVVGVAAFGAALALAPALAQVMVKTPGTPCLGPQDQYFWEQSSICPSGTLVFQRPAFQFGPSTSQTCDSGLAGMVQWTATAASPNNTLQYCNGTSWTNFASASSGILLGASATATNPQASGDAGTGLFSTTVSTVSIATAGVEALRVTATGSIGIGTTAPSAPLDVEGASGTTMIGWGFGTISGTLSNDQGGSIELGAQNHGINPITNASPYIDFHYGDGQAEDYNFRLINSASGGLGMYASANQVPARVSIGTGSQKSILFIDGTYMSSNYLYTLASVGFLLRVDSTGTFLDSTTSASGTLAGISLSSFGTVTLDASNSGVTTSAARNVYISGAPRAGVNETLSSTVGLYVDTINVAPTGLATNSYGMVVKAQGGATNNYAAAFTGGSVGIGTMTPLSKLDVNGNVAIGSYAGTATAPSNGLIVSGKVGIATSSPRTSLDAGLNSDALVLQTGTTGQRPGSPADGMMRYNTTANSFEFYQNGGWVTMAVASDVRLKTHITPVKNSLDIVTGMRPVYFDWDKDNPKASGMDDRRHVGFLAQELEDVLPEVVSVGADTYRTVEYGPIVAVTVGAVKEINAKVDSLTVRHNRLAQDVEKLQAASDNVAKMVRDIDGLKAMNDQLRRKVDDLTRACSPAKGQ